MAEAALITSGPIANTKIGRGERKVVPLSRRVRRLERNGYVTVLETWPVILGRRQHG